MTDQGEVVGGGVVGGEIPLLTQMEIEIKLGDYWGRRKILANPKETVLPQHLVDEIREAYEIGGVSQARLATRLGVSETTIFRVIHKLGAYARETIDRPRDPISPEMAKAAEESLQELLRLQAGGKPKGAREATNSLAQEYLYGKGEKKD